MILNSLNYIYLSINIYEYDIGARFSKYPSDSYGIKSPLYYLFSYYYNVTDFNPRQIKRRSNVTKSDKIIIFAESAICITPMLCNLEIMEYVSFTSFVYFAIKQHTESAKIYGTTITSIMNTI